MINTLQRRDGWADSWNREIFGDGGGVSTDPPPQTKQPIDMKQNDFGDHPRCDGVIENIERGVKTPSLLETKIMEAGGVICSLNLEAS